MSTEPSRRYPDPLIGVVLGLATGLLLTWLHHPRIGVMVIGFTVAAAALLRLLLPARDAGLLVIRSRAVDVTALSLLAAALLLLANVTPFPAAGP